MIARIVKVVLLAGAAAALAGNAPQTPQAQLVDVQMIWGRAPDNSFTDLARFGDRWYCVFREGSQRTSSDGAVRVLSSADGVAWQPTALVTSAGVDLRDPKVSRTSDGRLLLEAEAVSEGPAAPRHATMFWLSVDGREWGSPVRAADFGIKLWRVTWRLKRAYSMGFDPAGPGPVGLYSSGDGQHYSLQAGQLFGQRENAEASLLFLNEGSALCLLRGDGDKFPALLGRAPAPYRAWSWTGLKTGITGPNMIQLPDERFVVAGGLAGSEARTALYWLDPAAGSLTEFLRLPSGGDTGYPGLVYYDGLLWVSYHSSHEGRAMIYLTRVKLPPPADAKPAKRLTFGG